MAALVSWGIALFEYLLQVPANRIGYTALNLAQLKILQEVITLTVFVPFAVMYMNQQVRLDFLWAGLCLLGAVYFIFRGRGCRGRTASANVRVARPFQGRVRGAVSPRDIVSSCLRGDGEQGALRSLRPLR